MNGMSFYFVKATDRDFHSPVVKTSPSNAGIVGSTSGRGAKITHALKWKQNKTKQKNQNINNTNNTVTNNKYCKKWSTLKKKPQKT